MVRTVVLMLTAVVSSLVTSLLYLPYTWYRLGETFQGKEYVQVALLFLLPFLEMTVLAAAAFYQIFQRVDVCVLLLLALLLVGLGPWSQDTYLLYWMDLIQPGFFRRLRQYDDFPAGAVQPFAVAVPLWRALGGVPSVRSKPRQGYFWLHGLLWAKALLAAAGGLSSGKRSWLVFPPTLPGPCSACLFGYRQCNRGRDGLFQHGGDGRTYGGHS